MKILTKLPTLALFCASAFALSACGGSSDSSGHRHHTSSVPSILANGNEYSCPTEAAKAACTSDNSCQVAKCTLTKEVVKPVNPNAPTVCRTSVVGNTTTIHGKANGSCTFQIPNYNQGAVSTLYCLPSGAVSLNGSTSGGITRFDFNGKFYVLTCRS